MIASPKAAFVCIGNEILSGKTRDSNLQVLAQWLNQRGVRLAEVRVIADIELEIINTVIELSSRYDYVITSGGIGPTHDDITSAAIAKAFQLPLELDQAALEALLNHYDKGREMTESQKKMARLPQGAQRIKNPISGAVGFSVHNVFVLAGVPSIFQAMLGSMQEMIAGGSPWHSQSIEAYCGESRIAEHLSTIQDQYLQIEIGSYPKYDEHKKYYTELVFRSQNQEKNTQAVKDTQAMLKHNAIEFS